jgi:hypothetical protein
VAATWHYLTSGKDTSPPHTERIIRRLRPLSVVPGQRQSSQPWKSPSALHHAITPFVAVVHLRLGNTRLTSSFTVNKHGSSLRSHSLLEIIRGRGRNYRALRDRRLAGGECYYCPSSPDKGRLVTVATTPLSRNLRRAPPRQRHF